MAYNSFSIPRKRIIPREGLYIDPIGYILARTVFNPLINVPLFLLCRQFQLDHLFAYLGPGSREYLKRSSTLLAIAGGIFWVNQFLNWGVNNNFTRAKPCNPNKELVLITGGSSGIGAGVATRLAKEGNRVIVLAAELSPIDCKVILSHAGGALPYLISWCATPLRKAPNFAASYVTGTTHEKVMQDFRSMYYNVALSSSLQALDMLFKTVPHDHILYGSDFPYAPPPAYPAFLEDLESYEMDSEKMDKINFKNATVLFQGLKEE